MYSNKLEKFLGKPCKDFTKADIIRYFVENDFKYLNFRYVGGDNRLKKLSFVINSIERLESLLSTGERVDGSSLFSYVQACSSDLYVIPKYRTAFVNPFSEEPTLDILCSYYNNEGHPLDSAPEVIMQNAVKALYNKTGFELQVMGELEYYIIAPQDELYQATDQKGYHESEPYTKWDIINQKAISILAEMGADIKYAHSEVGNFKHSGSDMEQYEIEFNTTAMDDAANKIILAKWVLRNLGYQYGVTVSFAPKITVGKAGSGMHVHMKLVKDGKSVMIEDGKLSDNAKKIIAGILDLAPALTAFGNTIPTSYLRLVPHQEAPTCVCWGDRNRSVLIRVPLGWLGDAKNMVLSANPLEKDEYKEFNNKQTVEFRAPDGSANIFLLFAGLAVAARHGFEMENSLEMAEKLYVKVNIFDEKHKTLNDSLDKLPLSCYESAEVLLKKAEYFQEYKIFSKGTLESIAKELMKYDDKNLSENLFGKTDEIKALVDKYLHCA
jgi:glutamine synthetase